MRIVLLLQRGDKNLERDYPVSIQENVYFREEFCLDWVSLEEIQLLVKENILHYCERPG